MPPLSEMLSTLWFERELQKGDKLFRERQMDLKLGRMVKRIHDRPCASNTAFIEASRMGLVNMVWGFLEYSRKYGRHDPTTTENTTTKDLLWHRNDLNKTALDVATEEGHDEVAQLILQYASLEHLISFRNHEGKLPVSMLPDPKHDKFIWDTLEEKTKGVVYPPASSCIWISQENLQHDSKVHADNIMDRRSYPHSHKHNLRGSLQKLDRCTLELTPNKNTILHLVSNIGDKEYAQDILVKHPSLVYHRNSEGETPAYVAAREGHVDILAMMISYFKARLKDDIIELVTRSKDDNIEYNTALHIAIQNHHVGVVFWLMKEIPQLANSINDFKESPIYLAAERGYYHILKQMLDKGGTRTFDGPRGKTALHVAAISGSKECITCLLPHEGIDQKKRCEKGYTPLQYAVYHNNALATSELDPSSVYEEIIADGIYTSVVHIAASRGYCETLKVLMSRCPGCSELLDRKGKNIFHVAVENKQTEVIEFLYGDISYTRLVNQKDNDGNTPIHLLMASDLEMMEVAMDYRANINITNKENLTPLDMASSSEKKKKLLELVAASSVQNERSLSIKNSPWDEKRTEEEFQFMENILIVATLIATATFAAAFTVPGGFDGNEGSKQGMPILLRKSAFEAFMFFNTLAFANSCSALCSYVVLLVYRLKSNEVDEEARKSIHHRIVGMYYITGYALLSMIVAFITGIYVVLSPIPGLAIFLCVLTLFTPLYSIYFPEKLGSLSDRFIDLLWSSGK